MNYDKLNSAMSRIFFAGALLLLCLAVLERIVNFFGFSILRVYSGGRILEFAGVLLTFVIAVLLRQIREALQAKS